MLLTLLTIAGVVVTVSDDVDCVTVAQIEQAISRTAADDRLIDVELVVARKREELDVEIVLVPKDGSKHHRRLHLPFEDCTLLPRLVENVVSRAVEDLATLTWSTQTPPPRPELPRRTPKVAIETLPREKPPARLGWSMGLGVNADFSRKLDLVFLEVGASYPITKHLSLIGGLRGRWGGTEDVGAGHARIADLLVGAGIAYSHRLGPHRLWASALLDGGVRWAQGQGFVDNEEDSLPLAATELTLSWVSSVGIYLALGSQLTLIRSRLLVVGESRSLESPWIRIQSSIGFAGTWAIF